MKHGGHAAPCIWKNTKDSEILSPCSGCCRGRMAVACGKSVLLVSQWKASVGNHTIAGGDCVGICNMLMCKVKKKMNPIPQESLAYVKYIVSLSQSIYQPAECQLNCTGWCRYMVGCWCQTLLQLSFSGIPRSTQWNGRRTKAKLNVLEIMPLKRVERRSLAEKNAKRNVSS